MRMHATFRVDGCHVYLAIANIREGALIVPLPSQWWAKVSVPTHIGHMELSARGCRLYFYVLPKHFSGENLTAKAYSLDKGQRLPN